MEFTINISAGNFREFIEAMREKRVFSDLFDVGFTKTGSFFARQDQSSSGGFYTTRMIPQPQENSIRLTLLNEPHDPEAEEREKAGVLPPLAWDKIRADLERSGYKIARVDRLERTVVFEHSFVDPGSITNLNHKKAVLALIEAELSPERMVQAEIARRIGISESRLSEIKHLYLRNRP